MELFRKGVIAIYNTIDYHQYKRAISLCNQLLSSYRDNPLLLALKALSLHCDGQKTEGLLLCKRVQSLKPTDFGTLRALAEILQAEKKFEELNSLYQTAWERSPKDEELGNQYFMMLVGQKDYANMQKISIDLNKKFPKKSYQYWSIISILLRAQFTDQKQANLLYYPLAERMLTKLIFGEGEETLENGKVENFEEFYLYFRVLKSQNKLSKIEELLNSPITKNSFIEPHILNLKLEIFEELGYWEKIYKLGVDNLLKERDSWNIYLPFIKAVVNLVNSGDEVKSSNGELITIENTQKFFETLESSKTEGGAIKLKRGPYLAQLELSKSSNSSDLTKLIEKYFTIFSSKPSCYDDLVPYLSHLAKSDKLNWIKDWSKNIIEEVNDRLLNDSTSSPEKIKLTQTLVTIRKIERSSNTFNLTEVKEVEWNELIKALIKEYQLVLPLGENLLTTDKQYGDDLLLLAIHYGLDIYHSNHLKSQNSPNLILLTLIYFLEFGISKSPSNYHFKFLITRLYQLIGSFTSYGPHLKSLDIKQIQLDTLAHTWIHNTNSLGYWKQIDKEDSQCNFIYRSNEKETIDMIRLCFKNGTYSKIPEFLKFYTRLESSLQSRLNFIELVKGSWLNSISSKFSKSTIEHFLNLEDWLSETNLTKLDNLSDNRDFGILPNFEFNKKDEEANWNVEISTQVFPIRDNNWLKLQSKLILIQNNWYIEYTEGNSIGIKFNEKLLNEIHELKSILEELKPSNILPSDLLLANLISILPDYTSQEATLQDLNDKIKTLIQAQFDTLNKTNNNIELGRKFYLIYNLIEALGTILAFIQLSQPSNLSGKSGKGANNKSGGASGKQSIPGWIPSLKRVIDNYSQKLIDNLNQFKLPSITETTIEEEVKDYGLAIDKKLISQLNQNLNQNWKSTQKTYQVKVKNLI